MFIYKQQRPPVIKNKMNNKIENLIELLEQNCKDKVLLIERTLEIYTILYEQIEQSFDSELIKRVRQLRSSFEIDTLEDVKLLDIGNKKEFANLATVLFVVETQMNCSLNYSTIRKKFEAQNLKKFKDFKFQFIKELILWHLFL